MGKNLNRLGIILSPVLLVLFLIILATLVGCGSDPDSESGLPTHTVFIKQKEFQLELALTPEHRATGLMGRTEIAANEGMLFVFPRQEPYPTELSFWMKNCLVPIDLLFLDPAGQIIAIHKMEPQPPDTPDRELISYSSNSPAQYAIELQGGRAANLGLQIGDVIELNFTELLHLAE
jgi:uncharacterized protein